MANPSPLCQVKDGAGAYAPTTNGIDVTPGDTITINLVSSAGVNTWSISCITTDELSSAATVNAGLTIDPVGKTATFTAPLAGRAYRFQSKVNSGIGPDGTAQSSYTTTFGIFTRTPGNRRVHAVDETFESNAIFGWIGDHNDVIRNPAASTPTGTGFRHITSSSEDGTAKKVDLTAVADVTAPSGTGFATMSATGALDAAALAFPLSAAKGGTGLAALGTGVATFLGTPTSANLAAAITDETGSGGALVFATGPTISGPTLSGTPTMSGASASTSNDAKGTETNVNPLHVQTTDATVTTLDSFTLASNTTVTVSSIVTGVKSDNSQAACYQLVATFRNNSGTVAQVGSTQKTVVGADDASWTATIDNSTTTIRVRVTGKAATTIQWTGISTRLSVIP